MSGQHHHDHHSAHEHPHSFNFAFGFAVLLNLAFTLFQVIYALRAQSMSLLADAIHNFGDVFGLMLAWGANWLLTLPARKRYSYGFKKTTVIAALANALILVGTSVLITYHSIYRLLHPAVVQENIIIIVALIGIVVNGSTALFFMKGAHDDLNIKGAFLHLLGDAVISMGVVVAGILILYTHQMWIDPLTGIFIVLIILWGTWGLLRDSVNLILDAIPRHINHHGIHDFLVQLPGVESMHDLHIWGLSTKEVALTTHLVMPNHRLSDADYKQINSTLKHQFRIDHVTIQVEDGHAESPCGRDETC